MFASNARARAAQQQIANYDSVVEKDHKLRILAERLNRDQTLRIRDESSKTRLSILFYAVVGNAMMLSKQNLKLLEIFEESFGGVKKDNPDSLMGQLDWDKNAFPNPEAKIKAYGEDHLGLIAIEESYINLNTPTYHAMRAAGPLVSGNRRGSALRHPRCRPRRFGALDDRLGDGV